MKRDLKHNYRVSEYEDRVIRNKAKRTKTSVSAYVRKAALQKDIVVIDGLREMMPELHAIGNNLNQQTVIMRQNSDNAPHVDEMKRSLVQVMGAINERLKGGDDEDGGPENHQPADR